MDFSGLDPFPFFSLASNVLIVTALCLSISFIISLSLLSDRIFSPCSQSRTPSNPPEAPRNRPLFKLRYSCCSFSVTSFSSDDTCPNQKSSSSSSARRLSRIFPYVIFSYFTLPNDLSGQFRIKCIPGLLTYMSLASKAV